jgi:hypothetical protein
MRRAAAVALALSLTCSAIPAAAQQKPGSDTTREADRSSLGTRSVTGTLKKTTDTGFVVVGREAGQKDKEWAFALDPGTRIDAGGKMRTANELREGDAVTVTYTNRDPKIVAQSVKVNAR